MTTAAYQQIIAAPPRDRLDLFLATANRLVNGAVRELADIHHLGYRVPCMPAIFFKLR